MAVAPLAPHLPQLDLRQGARRPGPPEGRPGPPPPSRRAQAARPAPAAGAAALIDRRDAAGSTPTFQDQGVRPLLRAAEGDGEQDLPPPVQPEIQILHPLLTNRWVWGPCGVFTTRYCSMRSPPVPHPRYCTKVSAERQDTALSSLRALFCPEGLELLTALDEPVRVLCIRRKVCTAVRNTCASAAAISQLDALKPAVVLCGPSYDHIVERVLLVPPGIHIGCFSST